MPQLNDGKASFYNSSWENWNDMIQYSPAPRIRREKILSWLKRKAFSSMLDVGCGNAEFLKAASSVLPDVKLAGTDISSKVMELNRLALPEADFFVSNLNETYLDHKYDVVVCMEVIEHCDSYLDAVHRLANMTGKWLFLTVPCGPLFEIDRRVGHVRHFRPNEITVALESAGLTVVKLQQWGFPFFNLYKHMINAMPDVMCDSFLSSKKYSVKQRAMALCAYYSFKICVPWWGYQLFITASVKH